MPPEFPIDRDPGTKAIELSGWDTSCLQRLLTARPVKLDSLRSVILNPDYSLNPVGLSKNDRPEFIIESTNSVNGRC